MFASEDVGVTFDLCPSEYLDVVCPIDQHQSAAEPVTMPTGVLSLSQLKTLPLEQQVRAVFMSKTPYHNYKHCSHVCVCMLCVWACCVCGHAVCVGMLCVWACCVCGRAVCVGVLCVWACCELCLPSV